MAASGFTPILIYASGTASNTPLAANLTSGASGAELALNYADGKLFYKDSGGTVQVLATKGTGPIGGSNTQVQYNSSGSLAGSANLTFDGTTLTAAGLSGPHNGTVGATTPNTGAFTTLTASSSVTLSGGTANGVAYLNGSKVVTTGSALTFDGTNLGAGGATSPSAPIDIQSNSGATALRIRGRASGNSGALRFFANDNTTQRARFESNDTSFEINSVANLPMTFLVNDTEQMRLNSTGLGIGTSSPAQRLDVQGSSSSTAIGTSASIEINSSTGLTDPAGITLLTAVIDSATGGDRGTALAFSTSRTAGTSEKMRLDSLGNLGLGVTPSAWQSGRKAMQVGNASINSFANSQNQLGANFYYDGTNNKYISSDFSTVYQQLSGQHQWFYAASGTAGTTATFTQAMTLDASGNLGIGSSSPGTKLDVSGAASTNIDARFVARFADTSAVAANNGGGILFRGVYTGTTLVDAAGIQAYKVNATDGNYSYGLAFVTRTNGADLTTNMRLDSSGNLGLGVTPSAWSTLKAIQVVNAGFSGAFNNAYVSANAFYDGSNWKYINTATATYYTQQSGQHQWYNAASGTAGNAISFTQAMTLDASGNLGIGTSSPASKLQVSNTSAYSTITVTGNSANGGILSFVDSAGVTTQRIVGFGSTAGENTSLRFDTNGSEKMRLDSSGNLGLGVTPSAWGTFKAFDLTGGAIAGISGNQTVIAQNCYYNGTNWIYKSTAAATYYQQATQAHQWYTAASGTAGNAITFTQAMTLDASGNLVVGATATRGTYKLDIRSDTSIAIGSNATYFGTIGYSATAGLLSIAAESGGGINFLSGATERARIDSSGNLLVGTTTSAFSERLTVVKTGATASYFSTDTATEYGIAIRNTATSGNNGFMLFQTEAGGTTRGSITYNRGGGLVAYNTTSDYRAKTVNGPVQNALQKVARLKPSTGRMNGAEQDIDFFVAHELQEVVPSAVTGEKDAIKEDGTPSYQMVDKSALIPLLTAAIQEQQALITQLQADVAALKGN